VPGAGNSSPIVWGDQIVLATSYERGERKSLLSFSRSDGRKLWETFAPDGPGERAHNKNGHASGTPTTDGTRIYAYLGNHGLFAVDMNGKPVWHQSLGPFDAYHGTAGSPLLYQNRVIVYQDQVLLIAQKFAGYTLGEADIMRKAMGKKIPEKMAAERKTFISGAVKKGYSEEDAESIFRLIEPFA
jgi:hypothetical protein